jgi:hypothetical protein
MTDRMVFKELDLYLSLEEEVQTGVAMAGLWWDSRVRPETGLRFSMAVG